MSEGAAASVQRSRAKPSSPAYDGNFGITEPLGTFGPLVLWVKPIRVR